MSDRAALRNAMQTMRTQGVSADSPGRPATHLDAVQEASELEDLSDLSSHIDAAKYDRMVAKYTTKGAFLAKVGAGNGEVERVLELAYIETQRVGRMDHWCIRGIRRFLEYHVLDDLLVWNVVLSSLCVFVPVGSLVLMALALFAQPNTWTVEEIATLVSINSGAMGVGSFVWMMLTRFVPLNFLVFAASLPQTMIVPILVYGVDPDARGTLYVLAAIYGFGIGAVQPLYIGFNYAEQWAANRQVAAMRLGFVEPWRILITGILVGMMSSLTTPVNLGSPQVGDFGLPPGKSAIIPDGVLTFFISIASISFLLGVLALFMPTSETTSLLPSVELNILKYRTYSCLILADVVARLAGFLDLLFVAWLLMAGYSAEEVGTYFYIFAVVGCLVSAIFSLIMWRRHGKVAFILIAVGIAVFYPTTIGSIAAMSAPYMADTAPAGMDPIPFFLVAALVLSGLKRTATSMLEVFSLPSRFKYVTFQGYTGLVKHGCEAASPWLILWISRVANLPYETSGDWALANVFATSNFYMLLPFACVSFAINLVTLVPLASEGIIPWFSKITIDGNAGRTKGRGHCDLITKAVNCVRVLQVPASSDIEDGSTGTPMADAPNVRSSLSAGSRPPNYGSQD